MGRADGKVVVVTSASGGGARSRPRDWHRRASTRKSFDRAATVRFSTSRMRRAGRRSTRRCRRPDP